jgi:hypothetical protein
VRGRVAHVAIVWVDEAPRDGAPERVLERVVRAVRARPVAVWSQAGVVGGTLVQAVSTWVGVRPVPGDGSGQGSVCAVRHVTRIIPQARAIDWRRVGWLVWRWARRRLRLRRAHRKWRRAGWCVRRRRRRRTRHLIGDHGRAAPDKVVADDVEAHLQRTACHAVSGHWALNGVGGCGGRAGTV